MPQCCKSGFKSFAKSFVDNGQRQWTCSQCDTVWDLWREYFNETLTGISIKNPNNIWVKPGMGKVVDGTDWGLV